METNTADLSKDCQMNTARVQEEIPNSEFCRGSMFQTADMFKAFAPYRGNAVVIPGRVGRHWINLSEKTDRDVPLGDPAMGEHASFPLGLALARPDEKIILFDSEGDILNLGALPTIADLQKDLGPRRA